MLQSAGLDFVIRSNHDRKINPSSGESLKARIQSQACTAECLPEVKGNSRQRKKRMAQMEFRYEKVCLYRPATVSATDLSELEVYAVHVREKEESVPSGEKPTEWTLYTSHPVTAPQEALQVVEYYRLRWIIEDLFRTVKREGVDYESSELESGAALRKLFIMALMAAIQILQLRQARAGDTEQKTSPVFSDEQSSCLNDLLPRFEDRTQKQQNPFSRNNPAWAAWIIARLGG